MLKMMYYCTLCASAWRCLSVLGINNHFLKWYRAYLSSALGTNGNALFLAPAAMPPAPPAPVYPPYHPAPYVPAMPSIPPQGLQPEILSNAEFNQDNAHVEPGQPSNFNHMQQHMMLPDTQYYRRVLPSECRGYPPVYRAGYPELFDNANYEQRELPPEPRPDFRMDSNYVLVNREQRRLDQTWPPVNEAFFDGVTNVMQPFVNNTEDMFGPGDRRTVGVDRLAAERSATAYCRADEELEEELEALARRIDTEFKSAD